MKSQKRHMTKRSELPNREKIQTLGEKVNYEYFGILEADSIKKVVMKEIKKNVESQENQKTNRDKTICNILA